MRLLPPAQLHQAAWGGEEGAGGNSQPREVRVLSAGCAKGHKDSGVVTSPGSSESTPVQTEMKRYLQQHAESLEPLSDPFRALGGLVLSLGPRETPVALKKKQNLYLAEQTGLWVLVLST